MENSRFLEAYNYVENGAIALKICTQRPQWVPSTRYQRHSSYLTDKAVVATISSVNNLSSSTVGDADRKSKLGIQKAGEAIWTRQQYYHHGRTP